MLSDRYGRVATSLRVSLTDRCNLRCTYCMPAEGLDWLAKPHLLTDDEVVRVVTVAVGLGVRDVRLTGGEPLLRRGIVGLVERLSTLTPRPALSLTSNGIGLERLAGPLAAAGLDRVNVSLDTLDPARFRAITHRDRLDDVLSGLASAAAAGLAPVKVNAVLLRGVNDDEAASLTRWALGAGYEPRFIEQMPLDAQHAWDRAQMVTAEEILGLLRAELDLEPDPAHRGSAPAERWQVYENGRLLGPVGVVGSVTRPFCGACDRIRLTADGQIRNCLFSRGEVDLRGPLRSGCDDAALAALLRGATQAKLAGHGIDEPGFLQPPRPMSAIGG
ncbi:GTP 3',8-cyclase MoaA [Motilibacter aurantiacus]|uniref:GTP 3',8-cyclase MoaA n=1 Tax=Motilibacter aurantiacus TaxID=2714955 RepID=UPI0014083187|nr:GTP 3',8-cyclase MoaA [Motilibacter aurantiacus]NHC45414.1 GTP 3',8-cyclase MoaA [Motilibacter aurantiacus]